MSRNLEFQLPALRRYGALLLGSKERADDHLESVLVDVSPSGGDGAEDLYRMFHGSTLPKAADLKLDDFGKTDHQLLLALHKLPFDDRALLLLSGMADLGYERVTAILGIRTADVAPRLARARALMQAGYQNRLCVIVEDDLIAMRDLQAEVAQEKLGVAATAKNRNEAFDILERVRPDIALIDLALPEGSTAGADVAERLRSRFATRIIYVTAFARIAKELARSDDMIVPKPWSSGSLKRAIASAAA